MEDTKLCLNSFPHTKLISFEFHLGVSFFIPNGLYVFSLFTDFPFSLLENE